MLAATLSRPASKATRCRCARAASSLIASIDQGTSSSRVILYDAVTLRPVASHQVELQSATSNPQAGWSQMDAKRIVGTVTDSAAAALAAAGASASDVVGVGITNQRESTVVWDKRTGEPLYDCILWHDARTATTVSALADELGGQDALRPACGLPLSTYFSGVKLRWLLETVPAVKGPRSGISPPYLPTPGSTEPRSGSRVCCAPKVAVERTRTPLYSAVSAAFAALAAPRTHAVL
mmetsp:Transcript_36718/g.122950  ORF Transcript_36718/g.122950 Transcript_36718/m.122950 type:complete len:237 (+) Transcript_36718:27-737(+)